MTAPQPADVMARLLAEYKTASLATVGPTGQAHASYVPVAQDGTARWLFFVSDLSEHTENLRRNGQASLMLIEDESRSEQLFARNRITFSGPVHAIARESEQWESVAAIYGERFGKLFSMLSTLKDFHMFGLTPEEIRLVVGFGAAYRVTGPGWEHLELLTGK